ncbi:unnamed protein product, partial [Effrenium voratum]
MVGLPNEDQSCWLNTMIQLLLCTPRLSESVQQRCAVTGQEEAPFASACNEAFREKTQALQIPGGATHDAVEFHAKRKIQLLMREKGGEDYAPWHQADACAAFLYFLSRMEEEGVDTGFNFVTRRWPDSATNMS